MTSNNTNNRMGIWGPPVNSPYGQPVPSVAPGNFMVPSYGPRIRWGMLDVLWGFLFLIASQIFLSVALIVMVAVEMVSKNLAVEDPNALLDSVMTEVYSGPFLLISSLSMYLVWWLVTRWATMKKGMKSYAKDFWLKFNWKRDLPLGFGIALGLRLLEQAVLWFLGSVIGMNLDDMGNSEIIVNQPGIWYIINGIIVAGLLAPFFEEFFFRGLFLQASMRFFGRSRKWNRSKMGKSTWLYRNRVWISVIITSIAFGLMHFQGDPLSSGHWLVVTQTGLIGVLLAYLTVKTKSLGPAIAAHVFFNLSGVILATLMGG